MAAEEDSKQPFAAIDRALAEWRQGDCVLGEHWFVLRLDPQSPVTKGAQEVGDQGVDLAEEQVAGFVVLTQSCDIARACAERPFIEVCPLVVVDEEILHDIERGRKPNYGFVVALAAQRLVADLDRTMTVEKPVVAKWTRTAGFTTDAEARAFAAALTRKRARFAFPDDFNVFVAKLQRRLVDKHERETEEGRALRALREIRVLASPSWEGTDSVTITFWFIRSDDAVDFNGKSWATFVESWLKLVPEHGRYVKVHGQAATLGDLTAADYVSSDALDLDHLSRVTS